MPLYIDAFVLPVAKKNLKAYAALSKKAGKVFRELGAIEFRECVGDDLNMKMGRPFPRLVKPKAGETVFFSWIMYKSRAQRDRVNAKVMKDPRMAAMCDPKAMPFDMKRMSMGGFSVMVDV
ncbi:MAG: DUF1428 domain-containing protein [Planctomycetota bacterium]